MSLVASIAIAMLSDDVALLFSRCRQGLKPGGLIFIKENICKQVRRSCSYR
jgi:hypothetical protein